MTYLEKFKASGLTYTDVAHALGCCEMTVRRKLNGVTKITKLEQMCLDKLFEDKGDGVCSTEKHTI